MIIPYVAPLAQNELSVLRDVLAEGSETRLQSWMTRQAERPPTKGRPFLAALALLVAENVARTVPQAEFFHARLDGVPPQIAMAGRLVTATMNDDHATVDALALAVEGWRPGDRRDVVVELVRILRRATV